MFHHLIIETERISYETHGRIAWTSAQKKPVAAGMNIMSTTTTMSTTMNPAAAGMSTMTTGMSPAAAAMSTMTTGMSPAAAAMNIMSTLFTAAILPNYRMTATKRAFTF